MTDENYLITHSRRYRNEVVSTFNACHCESLLLLNQYFFILE